MLCCFYCEVAGKYAGKAGPTVSGGVSFVGTFLLGLIAWIFSVLTALEGEIAKISRSTPS